jgi:hypothetical protein
VLSRALFDPDDIMREVRAKAGLPHPANVAKLLKSDPEDRLKLMLVDKFASSETLPRPSIIMSFSGHRCAACGQPARFGYGVRLRQGREGLWFCGAHRPQEAGTA